MRLITYWTLDAQPEEALEILYDYEKFSGWWGDTFLNIGVLQHGPDDLLGTRGTVHSIGFLPYTFRWVAEVIAADQDHVRLSAHGDFCGTGEFRRPRAGEPGNLVFDWDVLIEEWLLKAMCPWMRPLYRMNHAYALSVGVKRLQREIDLRRNRRGADLDTLAWQPR